MVDQDPGENPAELPLPGRRVRGSGRHPYSHAREVVLQALYQHELSSNPLSDILQFGWLNEELTQEKSEFCRKNINGIIENWEALDNVIRSFSDKDYTQLSIIVRCLLRMAIFELMAAERDARIVMDDILNLTRKYDGDESVAFVNGVIDQFEQERREQEKE